MPADIGIIVDNYPDRAEWRALVSTDGVNLFCPQSVADKIAAIDLATARKAALVTYAGMKRWQKETGGITVAGVPIATDDRSKLMITGARIAADADAGFTTQWVGADGNVYQLNATQVVAISNAVSAHGAACFSAFAGLATSIAAGTVTTNAQVDAAFA